ncbi:hypothetical protein Droror1_Dr00024595 [Drosera rotundifolia]
MDGVGMVTNEKTTYKLKGYFNLAKELAIHGFGAGGGLRVELGPVSSRVPNVVQGQESRNGGVPVPGLM